VARRDRRARHSGDQVRTASPGGTPCRRFPDVVRTSQDAGQIVQTGGEPWTGRPSDNPSWPRRRPEREPADRRPTSFIRCGWARPRVARRPWSARATGRT